MPTLGIEPLRAGLQQMHAPSVGVTMLDRFKKIAVRRGRIDTGEHRLAALEDLVMQAHCNRRQIDGVANTLARIVQGHTTRCKALQARIDKRHRRDRKRDLLG